MSGARDRGRARGDVARRLERPRGRGRAITPRRRVAPGRRLRAGASRRAESPRRVAAGRIPQPAGHRDHSRGYGLGASPQGPSCSSVYLRLSGEWRFRSPSRWSRGSVAGSRGDDADRPSGPIRTGTPAPGGAQRHAERGPGRFATAATCPPGPQVAGPVHAAEAPRWPSTSTQQPYSSPRRAWQAGGDHDELAGAGENASEPAAPPAASAPARTTCASGGPGARLAVVVAPRGRRPPPLASPCCGAMPADTRYRPAAWRPRRRSPEADRAGGSGRARRWTDAAHLGIGDAGRRPGARHGSSRSRGAASLRRFGSSRGPAGPPTARTKASVRSRSAGSGSAR